MHEFSIAVNIVEIVEKNTTEDQNADILQVDIEVGQFAGVETDALELALQQASQDTRAQNTKFKIIEILGKLKCVECMTEFESESIYSVCPVCGSYKSEIVRGKELTVKSIEVD